MPEADRSAIDYAQVVGRGGSAEVSWPARTAKGMFHRAPDTERSEDPAVARIAADTPYLRGTETAPIAEGVVGYDPDRAFDGINLVLSAHAPEATLQDMKGNVLHRWTYPMEEVWSKPLGFDEWEAHETFWRRVHVFPNGDLLAIYEGIGMIRLDRQSRLLWEYKGRCHHDIDVDREGVIYTLARAAAQESRFGRPILEDFIVVLSPDGDELQRFSLVDAFLDSPHAEATRRMPPVPDVFHTNTIELLDDRLTARIPAFRPGSVLISVRNIDTLAVVDLQRQRVTWSLTGMWRRQHQPAVLDNGNLLLFDNSGNRGTSQVLELDPATHRIAWAYRGGEAEPFDSWHSGSSQRLPNGNTLITESVRGRAFEVTAAGEIVWEYLNPNRAGAKNRLIAVLSEVVRLAWDDLDFEEISAAREARGAAIDLGGVDRLLEPNK